MKVSIYLNFFLYGQNKKYTKRNQSITLIYMQPNMSLLLIADYKCLFK